MEIRVLSNPNNIALVRLPTSDFSLDSGVRLQMELLSNRGQILDRQYLEIGILDLPNFVVEGAEISPFDFFWQKALQQIGLDRDLSDAPLEPPPPLPDPMADYLKKKDATGIRITYEPTLENSIISATNLQSAVDQAISILAKQQSQLALLESTARTPVVLDTLNDLDNSSLDIHVPNTSPNGNKWVEEIGDWSIVANQAKSNGVAGSLAWIESEISNVSIECDVTLVDTTIPQGLVFRYSSNTSYWRVAYSKSAAKWIVHEITAIGTSIRASVPATVALGLTYKFKMVASDASLSFYVNDELKLSWTSTANSTATKHGLYASKSQDTRFKNFKIIAV